MGSRADRQVAGNRINPRVDQPGYVSASRNVPLLQTSRRWRTESGVTFTSTATRTSLPALELNAKIVAENIAARPQSEPALKSATRIGEPGEGAFKQRIDSVAAIRRGAGRDPRCRPAGRSDTAQGQLISFLRGQNEYQGQHR